jgi:hypothetical protein
MKTEEDEAFDDIARRQGGGGYRAKRQAAIDKLQEPNTITFSTSSADWVMRITADRRIEVNEGVEVTEAAQKVLEAMRWMLKPAQEPVACERCKQLEEQAYDLLGQLQAANLKWSVAHPWVGLNDKESIDIIKKDNNYKYPIQLLQAVMDALKAKNT